MNVLNSYSRDSGVDGILRQTVTEVRMSLYSTSIT